MRKRRLIALVLLLLLWSVAALAIRNDVLLPFPWMVLGKMAEQVRTSSFYFNVLMTLYRMMKGLAAALVCALVLGLSGALFPKVSHYFSVLNDIIKTIPNMSYIIIILIWLGAEGSVTVITFFIIFPGLYSNVLLGGNSLPDDLRDVLAIYPETLWNKIRKVYFPQIVPYLLSGLKLAFGLGFKVSVMAEILGQVRVGIGKQIYYARNLLDMTSIFAWTVWIIIISLLVDAIFSQIIKHKNTE